MQRIVLCPLMALVAMPLAGQSLEEAIETLKSSLSSICGGGKITSATN